jgi:hypothetical protein
MSTWIIAEWMKQPQFRPHRIQKALVSYECLATYGIGYVFGDIESSVEALQHMMQAEHLIPCTARIVRLDLDDCSMKYRVFVEDESFPPVPNGHEVQWFEWTEEFLGREDEGRSRGTLFDL